MTKLFGAVIFLAALMLFAVQPMVGKMVLPKFGGTPAIWNTCMVFFQTLLLLGYAYAHFSCKWLGVKRQALLHLVVLGTPFLVLPIFFADELVPVENTSPVVWLLGQLFWVAGLPFFVVSSTSPLLQRWFAQADGRTGDPYFLYSISNAGSLLALLGYPLVVEPLWPLSRQAVVWQAGYGFLSLGIAACIVLVWRSGNAAWEDPQTNDDASRDDSNVENGPVVSWRQRIHWVALAMVPSSLMLGVTTHITTDIASAPMFWILPLAAYLLTFVFVFARRSPLPHVWMLRVFPWAAVVLPLILFATIPQKNWLIIPLHVGTFFLIAMACHGELAARRPAASRLTEFYLWMSFGGLLGGIFNAICAPLLFRSIAEYPLMLVVACGLVPSWRARREKETRTQDDPREDSARSIRKLSWMTGKKGDLLGPLVLGLATIGLVSLLDQWGPMSKLTKAAILAIPLLVCVGFQSRRLRFTLGYIAIVAAFAWTARFDLGRPLYAQRGFFGVNRVVVDEVRGYHYLLNGRTFHGTQLMKPSPNSEPLSYFHRTGPLGNVFAMLEQERPIQDAAVIGLGTGTIASYIGPQQTITFFEIDPVVRSIAENPLYFTYLKDCRGKVDIRMGDARLKLREVPDDSFDILVLDAFSSDAIPAHLLTKEAVELYFQKVRPGGLVLMHISNKFLRLQPLVAALADELNLVGLERWDLRARPGSPRRTEWPTGKKPSNYAVLARERSDLGSLFTDDGWRPLRPSDDVPAWTDDYSNLWSVLIW